MYFISQLLLEMYDNIKNSGNENLQQLLREQAWELKQERLKIQSLRIRKSYELLRNTSKSIPKISKMIGYNDLTFFHALFKKKTGTSP
jgi:YesN/AraC family two-component response regulator